MITCWIIIYVLAVQHSRHNCDDNGNQQLAASMMLMLMLWRWWSFCLFTSINATTAKKHHHHHHHHHHLIIIIIIIIIIITVPPYLFTILGQSLRWAKRQSNGFQLATSWKASFCQSSSTLPPKPATVAKRIVNTVFRIYMMVTFASAHHPSCDMSSMSSKHLQANNMSMLQGQKRREGSQTPTLRRLLSRGGNGLWLLGGSSQSTSG